LKAAKAAVPIPTPEGVGTGERGQTLPVSTMCIYPQASARVACTKSRQYLRAIGICSDAKSLARALNERHRQDYLKWSAPGNKDSVFLAGWRASSRYSNPKSIANTLGFTNPD